MRNSINYNLDRRDDTNARWWTALTELQTYFPEEYAERMEKCNRQIGSTPFAQVATLEAWLKEIKEGKANG